MEQVGSVEMGSTIGKKILALAAAELSTIALFADVKTTGNLSMALNGAGIPQLIAVVLLFCVYYYGGAKNGLAGRQARREIIVYGITAVLFAAFMVIGKAQEANADLKYSILAVALFAGYVPLFYVIVSFLCCMVDKAAGHGGTVDLKGAGLKPAAVKITMWLFEEHVTAGVMLVVFLCRIPYLAAFYPCSMSWDGGAQICDFYSLLDTGAFSNHHPPLVSFLYGSVAYYSHVLGIPDIGMFVVPLGQTILSAYAVAKVCWLFKGLKTPYGIRWLTLAYFSLFTVWSIFDVTYIKDSIYWQLALLFTVELAEAVLNQKEFWGRRRHIFLMCLYGVLMMQTRNNGVFVLLFTLPLLFVVIQKNKKLLFGISAAAVFVVAFILNNVLYPALGVINLEVKEDTYCIMFQQTAKYGQDYPEDVTDSEREFLDRMFDYDELVEAYNPRLADWVKNCLKICEATSGDMTNSEFAAIKKDYFKVWSAQFRRHPLSYVNTFFECSYGYYYPEVRPYKEGLGFYEMDRNMFTEGMHPARQKEALAPARFLLEQVGKLEYAPGIGLLYRCGFYTWCVVFAAAYLLVKKRYGEMIITLPAAVNILVCLISPVNTCIRYAMPAMCMVPLICAVLVKNKIAE